MKRDEGNELLNGGPGSDRVSRQEGDDTPQGKPNVPTPNVLLGVPASGLNAANFDMVSGDPDDFYPG